MHDFDLSNTLLFYSPDFLKNFSVFLAKKNHQVAIWLSKDIYSSWQPGAASRVSWVLILYAKAMQITHIAV